MANLVPYLQLLLSTLHHGNLFISIRLVIPKPWNLRTKGASIPPTCNLKAPRQPAEQYSLVAGIRDHPPKPNVIIPLAETLQNYPGFSYMEHRQWIESEVFQCLLIASSCFGVAYHVQVSHDGEQRGIPMSIGCVVIHAN